MKSFIQTLIAEPFGGSESLQTMQGMLLALLVTVVLSACMMLVYRFCHDGLTYRRKFNITLIMLALSSTLLLAVIQNNPLFSLGALGALSICRIRTNTKDPRDLGFVFWALMIGVSSAMGAFVVGAIGSLVIGAVIMILTKTEKTQNYTAVVVRGEKDRLADVQELFRETPGSRLQSENLTADQFELVYELKEQKNEDDVLMAILGSMDGVRDVNVLAPKTLVA